MWSFIEKNNFPRLGWCAKIEKNEKGLAIKVEHGHMIEVGDKYFVEGVWDGDYNKMNFEDAVFFMGSGGKMRNDEIIFVTPSHAHERLYSMRIEEKLYISNSLPVILNSTGTNLLNNYSEYIKDLETILEGIDSYKDFIPSSNGKIHLHYYCNLIINPNITIKKVSKNEPEPFTSYKDYHEKVTQALEYIKMNSTHESRKHKYGMITTISKGYDATACAALSRDIGCDKAVTFDKPKSYLTDSGEEIAKILGFKNVICGNANDYLYNDSYKEAEFLSSGELGNGIVFSAFEEQFQGNLVIIGERGDQLWDKNKKCPNNKMRFPNANVNSSLSEHRLNIGYIFLPISLYGVAQWESIHKISNSKEMCKYSVGGGYDRPIPRRIVEERGVPRELFGQAKKGAGFNYQYDNLNRVKSRMSERSFQNFKAFYLKNKRSNGKKTFEYAKYIWIMRNIYLNYILRRIGLKFRLKSVGQQKVHSPGPSSYLFVWAVENLQKKYR